LNIREKITSDLASLEKTLNSTSVKRDINQIKLNFETAFSTVYKDQGKTIAGFKQVANTLTDALSNVDGSVPQTLSNQLGVAQLDVSAAESQLKKIVGDAKTDLETITGKAALAADGFLDVVIAAPFPEAIAAALKNTTTLKNNDITNLVQQNVIAGDNDNFDADTTNEIVGNIVGNLFPDIKSISKQLNSTVASLAVNAQEFSNLANKGFSSLVENIIERSIQPTEVLLNSATTRAVSPEDLQKIIELKQNDKIKEAANILSKYSDKTIPELEAIIIQISNRASDQVTKNVLPINVTVQRTDSFVNSWREENTNANDKNTFTTVIGSEITAEVLNLQREVTEVVVMFLPSPGATVEQYHDSYVKRYNIGFNPHYYIGYDGEIYRGRPLEIEAKPNTNLITNNHYKRSILVAVNIDTKKESHKFGPNQRDKLLNLLKNIIIAKDGIQIFSAADVGWAYGIGEDALDVQQFISQKLNRTNLKDYNPKTQDPLTAQQLATFNVGI